jgi:thiol-disulfide isomerase/thioredoxin
MIKYFIIFLLPFFSYAQQKGEFTLSGKVIGKDSGYVYLLYQDNNNSTISDSCKLKSGQLFFKGYIDIPTEAVFSTYNFLIHNPKTYDANNLTSFYLEPTEMRFSSSINNFNAIKLEGSRSDSDRVRLANLEKPIRDIIDSLSKPDMLLYDQYLLTIKKNPNSEEAKSLQKKAHAINLYLDSLSGPYYQSLNLIDSNFILENSSSFFAANLLWTNVRSGGIKFPNLRAIYYKLPDSIQKSIYGERILEVIAFNENIKVGMDAINFKAVSETGDTIKLDSYRGKKYVLLDFWASWCGPCRGISQLLNKMYNKYKDKLELISIAGNDKEMDWKKAIKKDHMDWIQILDNPGKDMNGDSVRTIGDMYFVNSIPMLMLIDENFKVVRIFGGSGKDDKNIIDLEKELQMIFDN